MSEDPYAYYYALRTEARIRTMDSLNSRLLRSGGVDGFRGLTLCSTLNSQIGDALRFAEVEWPRFASEATHPRPVDSWRSLYFTFAPRPDHFEVAVWQQIEGQQVLVGLAMGNPSHARTHLTIKRIERFFGQSLIAGRAMWPMLTCAQEYAKLLGCQRILIKDPVDSGLFGKYGYAPYHHPQVAHGGSYVAKELNNG